MDHDSLLALRQHHPAWHLLRADNAALVATTLHRVFVSENTRTIGQRALTEALDDDLYGLRVTNPGAYPKSAAEYLIDHTGYTYVIDRKGQLREILNRDIRPEAIVPDIQYLLGQ